MMHNRLMRWSAYLLPYTAVAIGAYGLSSAGTALLIYYCGILFFVYKNGWRHLGRSLAEGWNRKYATGLVVAFALSGVAIFLSWPFARQNGVDLAAFLADLGLLGAGGIAFACVAIALNPLLEEIFWRGCFIAEPNRPSAVDIAFGGYHGLALMLVARWWAALGVVFVLSAASWTLRFTKHRCGGLAVPCAAHAAADLSIVLSVYWLLRQ
jgi:membrane protease YdiL (CAAX protease family)